MVDRSRNQGTACFHQAVLCLRSGEPTFIATVRFRLGPADPGRKMTLDDFWDAEYQPGFHYELARGVVEVVQIPGEPHYHVVDNLHEAFSTRRREHPDLILRIGRG